MERGLFADQWSAFRDELQAAGHGVTFEAPVERRGGSVAGSTGTLSGTLVVVVLFLLEPAGQVVVEEIARAIVNNLRGRLRGNPRRQVAIVDQYGNTLRVVEVPLGDEEEVG